VGESFLGEKMIVNGKIMIKVLIDGEEKIITPISTRGNDSYQYNEYEDIDGEMRQGKAHTLRISSIFKGAKFRANGVSYEVLEV